MGYTTEFSGSFTIDPPIFSAAEMNDRLGQDWGTSEAKSKLPDSIYTRWCDWEVTADGAQLRWNGSEKSYCMEAWLELLISDVLAPAGHVLNGRVDAFGEERGDNWAMQVTDNELVIKKG